MQDKEYGRTYRPREGFWGVEYFERIPNSAIEAVEFNEQLKQTADLRLRRWFDPDFLLRQAAVFAIGEPEGELGRLQTPTMFRGALLRLDGPYVDEYGNFFGEVGVKGTGLTYWGVEHYNRHSWALPPKENLRLNQNPLGFFGFLHGKQEETVSNLLAEKGARVGRVIANIALNRKEFVRWYRGLPKSAAVYPLEEIYQQVEEKNGDTACLCVRLMGCERWQDFFSGCAAPEGLFSPPQILRRAARLVLWEFEAWGREGFLEKYRLDKNDWYVPDVEVQIADIAKGCSHVQCQKTFFFLSCYFYYINSMAKERLSREKFEGKLSFSANWQDIDLAGIFYDFETSVPEQPQYFSQPLAMPDFSAVVGHPLPYFLQGKTDLVREIDQLAWEVFKKNWQA